jgi:hypothetical protein
VIIKPKPDDPDRESAPATGSEVPRQGTGGSRSEALDNEVVNVSADGAPPLRTKRSAPQRDPLGRFASKPSLHRTAIMADGFGGVETVTGRFIPNVRNNAYVIHPDSGPRELPEPPDYSAGVDPARKTWVGQQAAQDELNYRLSSPGCTIWRC